MTRDTRDLLEKALALPEGERIAIVRVLIESLDESADVDVERAWEEEIARRIASLDSGKARTVSWKEVQERIAARLNHGE